MKAYKVINNNGRLIEEWFWMGFWIVPDIWNQQRWRFRFPHDAMMLQVTSPTRQEKRCWETNKEQLHSWHSRAHASGRKRRGHRRRGRRKKVLKRNSQIPLNTQRNIPLVLGEHCGFYGPGLNWLWFWSSLYLPISAGYLVKLAEPAGQNVGTY